MGNVFGNKIYYVEGHGSGRRPRLSIESVVDVSTCAIVQFGTLTRAAVGSYFLMRRQADM